MLDGYEKFVADRPGQFGIFSVGVKGRHEYALEQSKRSVDVQRHLHRLMGPLVTDYHDAILDLLKGNVKETVKKSMKAGQEVNLMDARRAQFPIAERGQR